MSAKVRPDGYVITAWRSKAGTRVTGREKIRIVCEHPIKKDFVFVETIDGYNLRCVHRSSILSFDNIEENRK